MVMAQGEKRHTSICFEPAGAGPSTNQGSQLMPDREAVVRHPQLFN